MNAAEWMRSALAAHDEAEQTRRLTHATAADEAVIDAADREAARRRAALGTGEARERLEEAVSTGAVDPTSHAAMLAHLGQIATLEVLARRKVDLSLAASTKAVVADRERSIDELVDDVRTAERSRALEALGALADEAARGRAERLEALADADERSARIAARGPSAPDAPPADLGEQASRFLDETSDAAADLVARALRDRPAPREALLATLRALSPSSLDSLAPERGRARRIAAVLEALDLGRELSGQVRVVRSRAAFPRHALVVQRAAVTILEAPSRAGLDDERRLLGTVAEALARGLVSRALPFEHAAAPSASAAVALGALFRAFSADPAFVTRSLELGRREALAVATASAAAVALEARLACAALVAGPPSERAEEAARVAGGRALFVDPSLVPVELVHSSRRTWSSTRTWARTELAALAWAPALRERYDVDFHRNPRLGDFFRGLAARGGLVTAEVVTAELAAAKDAASRRVTELAEALRG